ncbi:MAG: AMP-binding protein [Candidatus Bipolaricaulota bacterium]|nr:AMP-binding protein [Candidatus Bipolaricaulota bacterium]MCS7274345.1 AMP-binding protein [Candidatus Bipolaricaulota bacterium]MDW8110475.1 AMP-binding protein [Candidatus Bipolaricaulota bacterium]MDW8329156.1 AMP-binding protein [Candidatus Bipolaricaulota bacterium]
MTPKFAWTPTREYIEQSNVWRFMQKHQIKDYQELIQRSTQEIEWFWDAIVKELQIEFFKPYERVLDVSAGIAWAKWFVGGKINIAHNCVEKHARSRPDKIALIWEGEDGSVRRVTYRELGEQTNRLAYLLQELGIVKGDRVGIFMPMVPETVVAMMACAKLGAIFTPIFSGFGAQAVAARLNDCEAKLLLTAESFSRKGAHIEMGQIAREAAKLCPTVKDILEFAGSQVRRHTSPEFGGAETYDLANLRTRELPTEQTDSEDPFMIIYTSGTTGRPKGAVHVHGGFLVKIAQEVAHQVDLQDRDLLYWVTDMGWIMGPWEVVGGLALGGTVFLYEGAPDYPSAERLWAMVERHKISILGISPTLIRALMKFGTEPVRRHDLSSLRILASTGEPWNPDPWLWFFENVGQRRCPIINLSGGTEVGACFLSPLPITPLKPCALVGPALGMEIDVFDSEGKPLRGGVGELVCKKPWPGMTRGIWKDPERYIQTYWSRWPNVWVHGDWASIDEDGLWYLHGRSDDTIKIAGKRLGPAEIESILVGHPAVAESAAIGVPHELKGEAIWCYAVLRPGYEPSDALRRELRERVIEALGKAFAPEQIKFVRELPKTRNAKILRRAIRAKALGQEPGDLSNLENPQALEEIARAV